MKRVLALLLLLGTSTAADVVHLNDGTQLEGQLKRSGAVYVLTAADGSTRQIDPSEIQSIQKSAVVAPGDELKRLRRELAAESNPKRAINRLQAFIAKHPASAEADEAQTDLATWQHRADASLERQGDEWLSPEQVQKRQAEVGPAIARIQSLFDSNQSAEAEKELAGAIKTWPANEALQFLSGVALYRAKKLAPARKAFESVVESNPANAPAHNNIAVILWQTHQTIPALAEYEKAAAADDVNPAIIENVGVAIHSLPPAMASNAVARRVAARFAVLDERLSAEMQKQGKHRYGSVWLGDAEYATQLKRDAADRETIASYDQTVSTLKTRLDDIDRKLTFDLATMRAMDQQSNQYDSEGNLIQYPHPARYIDLSKEVAQLNIEKIMKTKALQSMPKKLADARANPGPQWNGKQTIISDQNETHPTTQAASTTQP